MVKKLAYSFCRGEVPVEEGGDLRVGVEAVLQLGEAVALVLVEQVLDHATVLAHPLHDLLGLPYGDPGVVLAMYHHKGGRYLLGLVDRAYRFEEVSVAFQRAVLGLAQGPPVATGVLEKGDHVGDPNYVHPGRPQLGVLRERGEHHEASVRATHHGYSLVSPPAPPA